MVNATSEATSVTNVTTGTVSSPAAANKMKLVYMIEALECQPTNKILDIMKANNISLGNNSPMGYKLLGKAFAFEHKDFIRYLLKNHCRPDARVKNNTVSTPLHSIIKLRDVKLLEEILEKNPLITNTDSDGNSCLHLAFLHKFEEAVDLLLSNIEKTKNFTNNIKNKHGLTHAHIACTRKNKNVIKGFLDAKVDLGDSVYDSSPYWAGYTAMHFAVDFGSLEAFEILQSVENGKLKTVSSSSAKKPWQLIQDRLDKLHIMSYCFKDQNPDDNGESETYFLLACLRKLPGLLKKFINVGAEVIQGISGSPFESTGDAALHFAVRRNHKDTVNVLLQAGAMPEDKNCNYMTALHVALYKENHLEKDTVLDMLYKGLNKVKVNVEDKNGLGYFQIAVTRNDLEVVKKFIAEGAVDVNRLIKPNSSGFSHFTPLHFAVLYQHKEMAKLLIKHGASVDLFGEENEYGSPLHMAFENGYKDLIDILLKSGASLKLVRAFDGNTILHLLVSNFIAESTDPQENALASDKQAILMYIEQVAKLVDINTQNKYGKTALHHLKLNETKCVKCLQLLLDLGADINASDANGLFPLDSQLYEASRCNSAEYLAFYHHVQKLEKLGLDVHLNNNEVCSKILKDVTLLEPNTKVLRFNELVCKQQQRDEEVARLKSVMITTSTSLYHFLKLEPTLAATYVPNGVLERMLMQKDFDRMYPSYGYLIRLQYRSFFQARGVDEKVVCSGADKASPPSKRQRHE